MALAGAGAKGKKKAKMHKNCVGFGHQQVIDAMNIGHWFIHVLHIFYHMQGTKRFMICI